MVKPSLAVSSHSSNPVSQVAYLIEIAMQERCDLPADSHVDYNQELATVVGLSFTAVLAEGSRVRLCRPHFATFLRYRDFIQHAEKLEQLSHAIAEMVCSAIYPFKILGFPLYYDSFVLALTNTMKSFNTAGVEAEKGIKKIIQELFEMCN